MIAAVIATQMYLLIRLVASIARDLGSLAALSGSALLLLWLFTES